MNLKPALKSMANDEKVFKSAAPMLFGDEFVTKATDRVEQLKAITKVATKPEAKNLETIFSATTPEPTHRPATGVETKAAEDNFNPTRDPAGLDQVPKDRRTDFKCKLYCQKIFM